MANEFIHIDPGAILTKAEFELITGHQFNSQATGDILYASDSTQLSRLGIGSNTNVLEITGGVPAWVATSGTGAVARVTSPTFVTPALGTPASGVMTNVSGTAASLTAGAATALASARTIGGTSFDGTANIAVALSATATALATARTIGGTSFDGTGNIAITTNANLTGVVTSSGNATAIADKALAIAKLADGTDGELITWNAAGVIAAVAAGSDGQVLTSGGAGTAPTFEAASSGATASTTLVGARTASAGAGTQSITGAGFDPTAAIIFGADKGSAYASWGIVDDANDADNLRHGGSTPAYDQVGGRPGIEITDGTNDLQGTVTLITDGVQIVWTKNGSGLDTDFTILCLR